MVPCLANSHDCELIICIKPNQIVSNCLHVGERREDFFVCFHCYLIRPNKMHSKHQQANEII